MLLGFSTHVLVSNSMNLVYSFMLPYPVMSILWFGCCVILNSHTFCRRENIVAAPGGHAASQNDLEICLASTQDQSIL